MSCAWEMTYAAASLSSRTSSRATNSQQMSPSARTYRSSVTVVAVSPRASRANRSRSAATSSGWDTSQLVMVASVAASIPKIWHIASLTSTNRPSRSRIAAPIGVVCSASRGGASAAARAASARSRPSAVPNVSKVNSATVVSEPSAVCKAGSAQPRRPATCSSQPAPSGITTISGSSRRASIPPGRWDVSSEIGGPRAATTTAAPSSRSAIPAGIAAAAARQHDRGAEEDQGHGYRGGHPVRAGRAHCRQRLGEQLLVDPGLPPRDVLGQRDQAQHDAHEPQTVTEQAAPMREVTDLEQHRDTSHHDADSSVRLHVDRAGQETLQRVGVNQPSQQHDRRDRDGGGGRYPREGSRPAGRFMGSKWHG